MAGRSGAAKRNLDDINPRIRSDHTMTQQMNRTARHAVLLLALAAATGACQDLDINNLNEPDGERALANPGDVESLIASSWTQYWSSTQSTESRVMPLSAWASEGAGTFANWANLFFAGQPRIAFDNAPTSDMHGTADGHWGGLYSALSNANEGLVSLDEGLVLDPDGTRGSVTIRAEAFGKFVQGLMHGYLGMIFDQAWVFTEEDAASIEDFLGSEDSEFVPYPDVLEQAFASMDEAIALTEEASFSIPWIWGNNLSSQDLAKLANSFKARFLVYGARTPEERAALDWDRVIEYVENGITEDFVVDNTDESSSDYKYRMMAPIAFSLWADYMLIGPGDISGAYQSWLETTPFGRTPFLITTPDRRITGADAAGDPDPNAPGKYFYHTGELISSNPERGPYLISFYKFRRWRDDVEDTSDDTYYDDGLMTVMTVDEMQLFLAEAYYHKGDLAGAAELINRTRTANGELPAVTAAGAPQTADCVPRMRDGSCGDLLNALMYERMIEGTGLEGPRAWLDSRGFGRLLEGTALHLPVPGGELELLQQGYYTFGGTGEFSSPYAGGEAHR
jgi:hypothetical protein